MTHAEWTFFKTLWQKLKINECAIKGLLFSTLLSVSSAWKRKRKNRSNKWQRKKERRKKGLKINRRFCSVPCYYSYTKKKKKKEVSYVISPRIITKFFFFHLRNSTFSSIGIIALKSEEEEEEWEKSLLFYVNAHFHHFLKPRYKHI